MCVCVRNHSLLLFGSCCNILKSTHKTSSYPISFTKQMPAKSAQGPRMILLANSPVAISRDDVKRSDTCTHWCIESSRHPLLGDRA